jgi:hypothetical protein
LAVKADESIANNVRVTQESPPDGV